MWNLRKNGTNEPTEKIEIESQKSPRGKVRRRDKLGDWGWYTHTLHIK